MKFTDVALILVSGAGLFHGLYSALFLLVIKKKKTLPNKLLGWLLIIFGYRVGKSIALYFMDDLEFLFIFSGLAAMLAIGPLLLGYIKSLTDPNFNIKTKHVIHGIPFVTILGLSPFITKAWFVENGVYLAFMLLIGFYVQFAVYIVMSWLQVKYLNKTYPKSERTQSQNTLLTWLKEIIAGISIIWVAYVTNVLDDQLPYIVGPILYSAVIYYLTLKGIQYKIFDFDAGIFQPQKNGLPIYKQLVEIMEADSLYKQQDLSLSKVGNLIGLNSHDTSGLINEHARKNFNDFVNQFRIQYAQKLLSDEANDKYTISSIAFDSGFNTLSSFNTAFKKFAGMTPSSFRSKNA